MDFNPRKKIIETKALHPPFVVAKVEETTTNME
jgi:hypothetical protein